MLNQYSEDAVKRAIVEMKQRICFTQCETPGDCENCCISIVQNTAIAELGRRVREPVRA